MMSWGLGRKASKQSVMPSSSADLRAYSAPPLLHRYMSISAETALANEMMDYWARFAATGDPNGSGAAQWVSYDAGENILQLDDSIVTLAGGYRNAQCDFLSTLPFIF